MAFAWLVLRASWKPARVRYKGKTINLDRGQLSLSVRDFATAIDRPKGWVERLLKRLENGTMVKTHSETGVTVLTICNYDKYQAQQDSRRTVDGTQDETDAGHRTKKGTNNKEQEGSILGDFESFWTVYPLKKSKPVARKAYEAAIRKTDHGTLVAAVDAQRSWRTWKDGFIPHASTWLNQERWSDEPDANARQAASSNTGGNRQKPRSMAQIMLDGRAERRSSADISSDGWVQTDRDGVFIQGPDGRQPF